MAPGTNVKFKIEATGVDLKFKWQKDRKTYLSDDDKYYETATDTLNIVEVEKGDEGRYRCHVTNCTGETFSEEAFLTVSKLVVHVFYVLEAKPTLSFPMYGCEIHFNKWYTCTLF